MPQQENALTNRSTVHFGIHRVYVEDLFGRYTYDLIGDPGEPTTSRLMILYGDNGSGKTTLLRLIVNLLSHVDGKGHKGRVADVRFKYFLIGIGGFRVEAVRRELSERGFTARVSDESRLIAEAEYYVSDSPLSEENNARHKALLSALEKINVGLFFLADDRKVTSNVLVEVDEPESEEMYWLDTAQHARIIHGDVRITKRKAADKVLEDAVARVSAWATSKALKASTQGEDDVNSIYSRIIQQLARRARHKTPKSGPSVDALVSAMREQYERSLTFSQFGLASPPKIDQLLSSVVNAPKGARDVIAKVLGPYVDGMKARLDALQDVQNSIASLVESINAFYTDKSVSFNLQRGLLIKTRDGESLKPTMLSSGERQLLLLFCNTIVAKQRPSVFIIDEPELSLNVKWQRILVSSLLTAAKDAEMQFVLATHSIELLTRYSSYVVELSERPKALTQ